MKRSRSTQFLHHVGAGLRQVVLRSEFAVPVLLGAGVIAVQVYAAWMAWHHAADVPWAGHATTLLSTLTALWVTAVVVGGAGNGGTEETPLFSVARGLATGYYFNFLRPLMRSLRQASQDPQQADRFFTLQLDGQPLPKLPKLHGLVVAIPCRSESICHTPAAGAQQIAGRCSGLQMHTIVFDRIRHAPDAVWSRPIELRLLREREDGPAVLLDVPTTLNVIHQTESHQPGTDGAASDVERATDLFVQVLNEFRDVVAQVGEADPLRHQSLLQVHVVPAEVAEHRIRELLSSGA